MLNSEHICFMAKVEINLMSLALVLYICCKIIVNDGTSADHLIRYPDHYGF